MVPKVENPSALAELSDALSPGTALVALVETALGVHRAYELAGARGVTRLAFGSIDFAVDIGAEEANSALLFARSALVVASRAARVAAPLDGGTVNLDDRSVVAADAATAASLGFGGNLCIHPHQVGAINAAFAPTEEDVDRAHRVLDSVTDGGAGRLDGQMVDRAVTERARLILRRARLGAAPDDARRE